MTRGIPRCPSGSLRLEAHMIFVGFWEPSKWPGPGMAKLSLVPGYGLTSTSFGSWYLQFYKSSRFPLSRQGNAGIYSFANLGQYPVAWKCRFLSKIDNSRQFALSRRTSCFATFTSLRQRVFARLKIIVDLWQLFRARKKIAKQLVRRDNANCKCQLPYFRGRCRFWPNLHLPLK